MKIAFLTPEYPHSRTGNSGGIGTSIKNLAESLVGLGHSVRILVYGQKEGCDIVWVEEAQTVSKKSWDILIPTIRKPNSEIWVSFNPNIDTDDTYQRFVVEPSENAKVVKVNYMDNPWFPDVLETERLHSEKTNPDYANIWEGECKAAVDGAIYANEIREAQENNRITHVPYDPMLKVHVVMDLGWNDSMSVILCQKGVSD